MEKLTHERLLAVVKYYPETGIFRSKIRRGCARYGIRLRVGQRVEGLGSTGHLQIAIDGRTYTAQQLAYFYMTGVWAENVDHRDTNRRNNRWSNLRAATLSQNRANQGLTKANTSGFKGVSWHKDAKKWTAQICAQGKAMHLGLFDTPEDASAAYASAAEEHFGEFARLR